MTQKIKDIAPEILKEIKKAKSILLHCHPSPDPDSVGSALATKFALEQLGKKITVIKGDSDIPKAFDFPGVETIVSKNYFEVDLKNFDLFIIQDTGSLQMISTKAEIVFPEHLMTIVIDHHASNTGYAKLNCIDSTYPATGQLLFDLFTEMGINIDHDIALNLLMGIYTDTGGFKYGGDMVETLRIASVLAKKAPEFTKVINTMENSNRKESLIFEGTALSSFRTYCGGKLGIVSVSNDEILKNSFNDDDMFTGLIANKVKSIIGIEISAILVEKEPNLVKVSIRSRDALKYDISKLALALGGGGHKAAAGVKMKMTLSEAISKLVNTTKEIYNI
jgi:phosphoesterase RecJ-like protein